MKTPLALRLRSAYRSNRYKFPVGTHEKKKSNDCRRVHLRRAYSSDGSYDSGKCKRL